MPRPHEPFADAMRTARKIVGAEVDALIRAGGRPDTGAFEDARQALLLRIAQAIVDAEEAVRHQMTG